MYDIYLYNDKFEDEWDNFIKNESINGTFLQSRKFLSYHPKERFKDYSLIIKNKNKIIVLIPATILEDENGNTLVSHGGSTFGGIIFDKKSYKAENIFNILKVLEDYLKVNLINKIILKITPSIFSKVGNDLLQYVLWNNNYKEYSELSTYIDFKTYNPEIKKNLTSGQKENYRHSLKNNLNFKKLVSNEEIESFYNILKDNLKKFNAKPIHSLEELFDLHNYRLEKIVEFFGVFYNGELVSGAMTFNFENKILHTQYLATLQEHIELRPMSFLYYNLIEYSIDKKFEKLSWGISTEEKGKYLNKSLNSFKESFGSSYSLNKTFFKTII